jgi:hypothetical protein
MDTQLDHLVIRTQLIPLSEKCLGGLKKKIENRRRENWLEIYLTMFILLCNVEWCIRDILEYTTAKGRRVGVAFFVCFCFDWLSRF